MHWARVHASVVKQRLLQLNQRKLLLDRFCDAFLLRLLGRHRPRNDFSELRGGCGLHIRLGDLLEVGVPVQQVRLGAGAQVGQESSF